MYIYITSNTYMCVYIYLDRIDKELRTLFKNTFIIWTKHKFVEGLYLFWGRALAGARNYLNLINHAGLPT